MGDNNNRSKDAFAQISSGVGKLFTSMSQRARIVLLGGAALLVVVIVVLLVVLPGGGSSGSGSSASTSSGGWTVSCSMDLVNTAGTVTAVPDTTANFNAYGGTNEYYLMPVVKVTNNTRAVATVPVLTLSIMNSSGGTIGQPITVDGGQMTLMPLDGGSEIVGSQAYSGQTLTGGVEISDGTLPDGTSLPYEAGLTCSAQAQ